MIWPVMAMSNLALATCKGISCGRITLTVTPVFQSSAFWPVSEGNFRFDVNC
jgi:hypothetical protein